MLGELVAKRDPEKTRRLRNTIRYLIQQGNLVKGNQATLARHFQVSRQRVHQIVNEERARLNGSASSPTTEGA
jgi:hypothetical protein